MKILICGDRNWTDYALVRDKLEEHSLPDTIVIEGEARGADKLGRQAAESLNLEVWPVPADWAKHHRAAGPIRNQKMLLMEPDLVLAFHENIAASKGTADMVRRARKAGVKVIIYGGTEV